MNIAFMAILALAAAPAQLDTSATPTTRLFVRTVPHGATVTVDGEPIGKSDGLFVLPGGHKITVELDGSAAPRKPVKSRFPAASEGSGSRLQEQSQVNLYMTPRPDAAGESTRQDVPLETAGPACPQSKVRAVPTRRQGSVARRFRSIHPTSNAHGHLRHPAEAALVGRDGNTLFGMAIKPLPQTEFRSRTVPAMLELVADSAVHEVLRAKSLLDRYAAAGLTDATTRGQKAVEQLPANCRSREGRRESFTKLPCEMASP